MTSPNTGQGTQTLETDRARMIDVWKDAEVYWSTEKDPKIGFDGSFDPKVWSFVGLLNDGSAITQEPEVDRTEINSFGGVLQLLNNKFKKDVRGFDALEMNDVTFPLLWPGSDFKEGKPGVLMAPENPAEGFIAFKTTNSFGDVYIDVSRRKALVYSENGNERNDDGASVISFKAEIRKDQYGALYDYLRLKGDDTPDELPEVIRFSEKKNATGDAAEEAPSRGADTEASATQ
ncbi:hypothetical protein HMPREF2822_12395 [Corynebacterium sp. HMSC062E11]|uniref:hypothetical protein n=1 Tax=Corynebacterium sp. HMSC062E11 TaxID=1739326 RepID=UPI0008A1334E|nr:hypothetical protein [Corynebacterium sp. HMSC062E11]OFK27235.1 hypothetical protein HMPREF2822_12395 [Corynebacterium sp. HMSC062E11]